MKHERHSEKQIIGILKQHEAGVDVKELMRQAGISGRIRNGLKLHFIKPGTPTQNA